MNDLLIPWCRVSPKKDHRGFTLIEILTVVSVTMILTSIVLTLNSSSRYQLTLLVESSRIAQVMAKAKSYAIATYAQTSPPCGYGVHVDYAGGAQRYVLFSYSLADCSDITFIDTTSAAYRERSVTSLTTGVQFSPTNSVGADAVRDILFLPPDPHTLLWSGDPASNVQSGSVVIRSVDGKIEREVTVNNAGQITF